LPHIGNRKCIKFVLQRFFLNKTQGLTFLSRNLYGWVEYPSDINFQNSEFAVLSLAKLPSDLFFGEICLTKLKDFTFLVGICMGGTLRMANFKILSFFLGS
jgi:hypothetical protein